MKKLFKTMLFGLLGTALLAQNVSAAEYNLKLQTYYPASMLYGLNNYVKNIEEMSNGRVKIQVFTGGELVTSSNILKSVKSGMIDMGQGMGHHFTEMKVGTLESGLPLSWMSPMEAQIIYEHRGLKQILEKEYEKAGVVYLGPTRAAPYNILTKTPVSTLDELRKLKVRAVGATAKMLNILGVATVNLPTEDIYMALTTGQIDGVIYGNASDYKQTKFYEAAKYLNVTPLIDPITDTLIINKRVWDSFPSDIQAIFRVASDRFTQDYLTWGENDSLKVIDEIFKGNTTTFSEADQRELLKAATQIWDEEAKRSPEFAQGVEILKQFAREKGRL